MHAYLILATTHLADRLADTFLPGKILMRTVIQYQKRNTQIVLDEPDEFSLTDQETQIELLEQQNLTLETKNAEMEFKLQYLERIIAEFADSLCDHHLNESDSTN